MSGTLAKIFGTSYNNLTEELIKLHKILKTKGSEHKDYKEKKKFTEWIFNTYIGTEDKETNDDKKKAKRQLFKFIFDIFKTIENKDFDKKGKLLDRYDALKENPIIAYSGGTILNLRALVQALFATMDRKGEENNVSGDPEEIPENRGSSGPIGAGAGPVGAGAGPAAVGGNRKRLRHTRKRQLRKKRKQTRSKH